VYGYCVDIEVPNPAIHVATIEQRPDAHDAPVAQTLPHAPQFSRSVERSTHGGPVVLGQSVAGAVQLHVPAAHVPKPQACAQLPQLLASLANETQCAPPQTSGVAAGQVHTLETQLASTAHECVHPPQRW
jgi:hypothetical protein